MYKNAIITASYIKLYKYNVVDSTNFQDFLYYCYRNVTLKFIILLNFLSMLVIINSSFVYILSKTKIKLGGI